jgi:hypothetical protein
VTSFESRRRPPQRSGGARILRILVVLFTVTLVFLLGVSFAQTLDERPKSGPAGTTVRTLSPVPQGVPDRTVTVTVTVTSP